MIARSIVRGAAVALLVAVSGCSGIDLGDNPGHEFAKETGPLTVPPPEVRNGTAH